MKFERISHSPADKPGGSGNAGQDTPKLHESQENYDGYIYRVTPEEFAEIPNGTELVGIMGNRVVKGDPIDMSTQEDGFLACGFPPERRPNWLAEDAARRHLTTPASLRRNDEMRTESPKPAEHVWVNGKPLTIYRLDAARFFFFSLDDTMGNTSVLLAGTKYELRPSAAYEGFVEIIGLRYPGLMAAARQHADAGDSAVMM